MLKKIVLFLILAIITVACIYPVLTVLTVSLRPGDRLLSTSLAIIPMVRPSTATLRSFVTAPSPVGC